MLVKVDLGFLGPFSFSVFFFLVSDSFAFCLLPQQLFFFLHLGHEMDQENN